MAGDEPSGLHRWRRRSSRNVYQSPWTCLREDTIVFPNGHESTYSVFELGQCVGVLPILDDGRVVLVRQYRYIGDHFPWEMPTGNLVPDESPRAAANRELGEEAGYCASTLEPLGSFHTSKAHCEEVAHLFVAHDLRPVGAAPDATEELERGIFSFEDVLAMVLDGRIVDSMTIIAVLRVALSRRSLQ
ncbi:MAG TPA: NUDIX hydrolase [Chloroflexota bacterium]|jgi:ADP-ribose pyrophosphatase|nr:NUDIX hydrolase [Chloroflexota bacterium]